MLASWMIQRVAQQARAYPFLRPEVVHGEGLHLHALTDEEAEVIQICRQSDHSIKSCKGGRRYGKEQMKNHLIRYIQKSKVLP